MEQPEWRGPPRWLLLSAALLLCACGRPPATVAEGSVVRHDAGFEVVVPDGWQVQESRMGLSLIRQVPYGGGFPTLSIRRIDRPEAEALEISGSSHRLEGTEVAYTYRSWSNSRGRGYRLDALLDGPKGLLFTEASVWDPSPSLDRLLFEEQFWPIINSIVDQGP